MPSLSKTDPRSSTSESPSEAAAITPQTWEAVAGAGAAEDAAALVSADGEAAFAQFRGALDPFLDDLLAGGLAPATETRLAAAKL